MINRLKRLNQLIVLFSIILLISLSTASACKDIIATGNSTAGNFNLLLKVRDPSRPGYQVLTKIPENYQYSYHHPWTGEKIRFIVNQSYIGVASEKDIAPNITKSGMVLTNAGLAYGDADSQSRWINPTQYAWDDFDWIRYSCEQATTEDDAVHYLTKKAVDELHATGVSENLCLIGPNKGYLIEADAYRYKINEIINDIDVISNYARELWKTQLFRSRFIAESYNSNITKTVNKGDSVHLNGLARIKILQINPESIKIRQTPFFTNIGYHDGKPSLFQPPKIVFLGESKTVGDFYVSVNSIDETGATVSVTTSVNAWEQSMLNRINQKKGEITVRDMFNWSRLQKQDVKDVRPMCEEAYPYEGVAVYKVPTEKYHLLSKGWFSPNHACSSIYVPFHNSNIEIFDKYESSEAAKICLYLYNYSSNSFLPIIESVEQVFLKENDFFDTWAQNSSYSDQIIGQVLTSIDITMQKQAWTMQKLFYNITFLHDQEQAILSNSSQKIWNETYSLTMISIGEVLQNIKHNENFSFYINSLKYVMSSSTRCYIDLAEIIGYSDEAMLATYHQGVSLLEDGKYALAAMIFHQLIDDIKQTFISN